MASASTLALRVRRRGRWLSWTAEGLQADVAALAAGWRAVGVKPGDTITALGPLSAALVLTLRAAPLLGARVQPLALPADVQAPVDAPLAHVLVDGTHELEVLLARRPAALGRVVIAHPLRAAGSDSAPGVQLQPYADLLRQRAAEVEPNARVEAAAARGPRVLAEFEPHWQPGYTWLQQAWPRTAATLVIPEPGGDAWADRRDAKPDVWLAPLATLQAVARELSGAARHAPAWWLRLRAASVLGLRPGLRLVTDGPLPPAAAAVFEALGAVPATAAAAGTADWAPQLARASA